MSKNTTYKKFINKIIPKTRMLFNLMKKYINGKLSLHDVVGYLEPFLIYTNDLTFMQYKEISQFLQLKISEYNSKFKENEKLFSIFKNKNKIGFNFPITADKVISLVNDRTVQHEILNIYKDDDVKLTNSELLWKMITSDFSNIFNSAIALESINTMIPENISSIIDNLEKDKNDIEDEMNAEEKSDKCLNIVISKQYKTLEEVAADNDKITYYDKKFDETNYGILDDYQKEQISMLPDDFYNYLIQKLINKNKFLPEDSPYIAETLITGMKRVVDGDFAIMYDSNEDKMIYFKRSNNRWVKDDTIDKKMITSSQSMLCNFQKDCIEVDKKYKTICESQDINKKNITENALKEIVSQFDKKYQFSKETLHNLLSSNLKYNFSIMEKLELIKNNKIYKYNQQQYKLGISSEDFEKDIVLSPYISVRDVILGQSDFCKRQNDIIRFTIRFTRNPTREEIMEDETNMYWLFCRETNTKLLPSFLYRLAVTWVEDPENYMKTMNLILNERGKLGDDGESRVDEYSGYKICNIDFDIDEGYEEGYRVNTRAVMEQDIGDAILNSLNTATKKYITPETKMISNIINVISEFMGIHLEDQKEFIIRVTTIVLSGGALVSEEDYKKRIEEAAKKGKKIPSYKTIYNGTILYLTLGAILIAIQTSIPSIKTRKTFPGCVRSFTGYPFEGTGDSSGLIYLSCIAHKIEKKIDPWSALSKLKETDIAAKIKIFIETYYINNEDVTEKMKEKLEYLLSNPNESIPVEYSLNKWNTFLPPLLPFKIKGLINVSDEFKQQMLRDFKSGSTHQREKLLIVESKMIQFSLAIQEKIQKIVDKKNLILKNSANEPFLENACCNDSNENSTIKYFIKDDNDIFVFNNIVQNLSNIMDDVNAIAKAPFFFCRENSKNIYAQLSEQYNNDTIYTAFIVLCKFNSIIPISPELDAICGGKPDYFVKTDSISEKIRKLKQEGKNYNNDSLLRLLQYTSKQNIVHISLDDSSITQIQKLRNVLDDIQRDEDEIVSSSLVQNIDSILDTFDIAVTEDTEDMRNLKNYLGRVNKEMKIEIYDFISKNSGLSKHAINEIKVFLNTFLKWGNNKNEDISDDSTYNLVNFVKEYIKNMLITFPEIILNKVDYQSIKIPNYWGLSQRHVGDIKNIVSDYYSKLRAFYDNNVLFNILTKIPKISKNLLNLVLETPYFSEIDYKNQKTFSIFDKRTSLLLFENYFLQTLIEYKKMAEDTSMLTREKTSNDDETLFTVEELDDESLHMSSKNIPTLLLGNIKDMKIKIAKLLSTFISIMSKHKDIIDLSYDKIMETVFKSKEKEKDTFTDRLQALTEEERNVDTILKINKLGVWNKGLQKGLTTYVKETYDEERDYMEKISQIEKNIRKNKNVNDNNIDQFLEDYMEEHEAVQDIDREENDITNFLGDDAGEDYFGEELNNDDYNEYE